MMTIPLPLQPQEEAQLPAAAKANGVSPGALLREAVRRIIAEAPADAGVKQAPALAMRGVLANDGPAPPAEQIGENRAAVLATFPPQDDLVDRRTI